jgi:hypothetical protein
MLLCDFSGSMTTEGRFHGSTEGLGEDGRKDDSPRVRELVPPTKAEGPRLTSIEQGRRVLLRYERFLADESSVGLEEAGWKECAVYKIHWAQTGFPG